MSENQGSGAIIVRDREGATELYRNLQQSGEAMAALNELGKLFVQSQIMGCKTPGDGLVLAMTCFAERITPLEFVQTYHVIQGRPSMRADAMLAKFRSAGGRVRWINVGDDGKEARAVFVYGGDEMELAFTVAEAEKLIGKKRLDDPEGNWWKSRGPMLRARLTSKALRIISPELVSGTYLPEEIEESLPATETAEEKKAKIEARRAELKAMETEAVEQSEPPAATTTSEPAKRGPGRPKKTEETPTVAPAAAADPVVDVPFEPTPTPAATPTPLAENAQPCSMDQLQKLVILGEKLGLSIEAVRDNVCEAASVDDPTKMTHTQAEKLLARFTEAIGKL